MNGVAYTRPFLVVSQIQRLGKSPKSFSWAYSDAYPFETVPEFRVFLLFTLLIISILRSAIMDTQLAVMMCGSTRQSEDYIRGHFFCLLITLPFISAA